MIHKYTQNGYNIVLDVNSGTVHVFDDLCYRLADYAGENMPEFIPEDAVKELSGQYSLADLDESWSELYELYQSGFFYSKDDFEKYTGAAAKAPIKSMCLNIAHDCNLRCSYCFASTGDFGGGRKLMPLETAKKALDFLMENSGSRHNLEVDFFGGEPLMNFEVVRQAVLYGREIEKKYNKNIRFTITTNGLLLDDDKIDFINREMSNVVLSIDGRKDVNDRMRKRVDGSGCYDEIMAKFKKLVAARGYDNYYVRGTYTHQNLDFAKDVMHLVGEGFDQVSVEPVTSEEDKPYALQFDDLPVIFKQYDIIADKVLEYKKAGKPFNFFHYMIDLDHGPCVVKLLKGCGCGNEYVAVTPDGDLYPCHQFVGREEWKLGNVNETKGKFENKFKDMFSKANIYTKESCKTCWARYFCSGGCSANNSQYNGDILKPLKISCEMERKRLECAIMIKAALSQSADEAES